MLQARALVPVAFAFTLAASSLAGCSRDAPPAPATSGSSTAAGTTAASDAPRKVSIEVKSGGFSPSTVDAKSGEKLLLTFTRTTPSGCGSEVVFPDLRIQRELPVGAPVDVAIDASTPGTIFFQCGMAMMRGRVLVK